MKVFVTGATGNIGAHIVKLLSEKGHTIHVLARSMSKLRFLNYENVVPFEGDILDINSVQLAMKDCEQVYHVAAFTKAWSKDVGKYYAVNVGGTRNILDSAVKLKVSKVVFTSTAGVFGPSINGIVTEDKIRDIDFFNEYEGSKAQAESIAKEYIYKENLYIIFVSPSRVYGPSLVANPIGVTLLIEKYINRSWWIYPGSGREIGNYVYIEDVAQGHILAMEKGNRGHTYLIGGDNLSYRDFFAEIRKASGINRKLVRLPQWLQILFGRLQLWKAELLGVDPLVTPKWIRRTFYNWELNIDKSKEELGLQVTPIDIGMKKTIEYIQQVSK